MEIIVSVVLIALFVIGVVMYSKKSKSQDTNSGPVVPGEGSAPGKRPSDSDRMDEL